MHGRSVPFARVTQLKVTNQNLDGWSLLLKHRFAPPIGIVGEAKPMGRASWCLGEGENTVTYGLELPNLSTYNI